MWDLFWSIIDLLFYISATLIAAIYLSKVDRLEKDMKELKDGRDSGTD